MFRSRWYHLTLWKASFAAMLAIWLLTLAIGGAYIYGQNQTIRDLRDITIICPDWRMK